MPFTAPAPASAAADDTTLVARYVAGDDHAFAPLLARHQGRVFTTLVLIVRDRALAEDLTQDTFIKAVKMLREGRYEDAGKFGAWVCRIAHNLGIDATRRAKRSLVVASLDTPLHPTTDRPGVVLPTRLMFLADTTAVSAEDALIRTESHDHLRRLIQDLPVAQRQVLLMRHYGEMTFQDIADATGVSVNTALGRMRYALLNLRRRMHRTATGGTSLLLLTLLAATTTTTAPPRAAGAADSTCFTFTIPPFDSDDSTLYPGNAAPLRV